MAENFIVLLILATIIGAFWLVLLSAVWRRQHRALWKRPKAHTGMKRIRWSPAFLGVVGASLALMVIVVVIAALGRLSPRCTSRIKIIAGPRGATLECVCNKGRLATCFPPGP